MGNTLIILLMCFAAILFQALVPGKWNKIERGMNKRLQVAQNDHAASGSCVSVNINLHQLIVMVAEGARHFYFCKSVH